LEDFEHALETYVRGEGMDYVSCLCGVKKVRKSRFKAAR